MQWDKQLPDIYDSTSGQLLKGELAAPARSKEMGHGLVEKKVYDKVLIEEAIARIGKQPILVKWVDTNKGDDLEPNYRSRLVAKDIRTKGEDSIFAPSPPLEAFSALLTLAAIPKLWMSREMEWKGPERIQASFIE